MNWLETVTGHRIDFTMPNALEIRIFDIAHGLSRAPRFAGHTRYEWNVAAHSVVVASVVSPEHKLEALLHDATEAYMGDVASPLKALCDDYRRLECGLDATIRAKYGLHPQLSTEVHEADQWALEMERQQFMPNSSWSREIPVRFRHHRWVARGIWPYGLSSYQARLLFLECFAVYCPTKFKEEAKWAIENCLST